MNKTAKEILEQRVVDLNGLIVETINLLSMYIEYRKELRKELRRLK